MKKIVVKIMAVFLAVMMLTGTGTVFAKVRNKSTGPELNFRMEELHVMNGDEDLYGEMYLPVEEQEKYPTIVMCHGLGSNANAVAHHAKYFATNGFAAYIFDVRHGGNGCRSGENGEDMTQLSPLTVCDDLNAVIDFLKTLPYVDADHFFLGGVSMGGFMSAYVSAQRPDEIKAIILQSPGFSITETYAGKYNSPDEVPETEEVRGMVLGKKWILDAMDLDIYEHIKNYKNPVLIGHGDADEIVDLSYAQKAAEIYENATLIVYPKVGHAFAGKDRDNFEAECLEFLKAQLD